MPRSLIAAICLFAATNQLPAADWPAFLGPEGAARSSDVVPTTWSNSENLAWKVDLPGTGSSSPIIIGDKLYVVTRRSGTIVFKPGDLFKPLARNVIEGDETDFNATPAVSDNKLYLRSNQSLYCIADSK